MKLENDDISDKRTIVFGKTLNFIQWWSASFGHIVRMKYLFFTVTPSFTLTRNGSTCCGQIDSPEMY